MAKSTNKLIKESSPYLLQHAYNPVDWFAWNNDAFEKAKTEDKPIFLSIGYSTCHWCHVMERESFEDDEVAKLMNENFISIKVDREERPDIDNIYMEVCQILTGSGGWPLNLILTPDKKPFFAGTYFPKYSIHGRIGMMDLIPRISNAWKEQRNEVENSSNKILEYFNRSPVKNSQALDESIFEIAFVQLNKRFDENNGGFGSHPKFPSPHNFLFLLRHYQKTKNIRSLDIVTNTLQSIKCGGICDHIGFGYHRYSTDSKWLVPHFEKMLYDQAMLAIAFIETFQSTGNKYFKLCTEEIFNYVIRDMTDSSGGFYSAEDADSEGEEGKFYLWTYDEIINTIGEENVELFVKVYKIDSEGNYPDEFTKQKNGKNIIHLENSLEEISITELSDNLELSRQKLFNERKKRIHPLKDDKILTSWNGLMIAALAKGGILLNDEKYLNAAKNSADFIISKMYSNGRLLHRYRNGVAGINANLDDYSFFIWGLLELYESTLEEKYLEVALKLNETVLKYFWDEANGGFYFTATDSEKLITRQKEIYDGAIPSGNSIALQNLMWLHKITARNDLKINSELLINSFSNNIKNSPSGFTQFLCSFDYYKSNKIEIVIVDKNLSADVLKILKSIKKLFIPNKIILFKSETGENKVSQFAPFLKDYKMINGKPTIYICSNYKCESPTNNIDEALKLISNLNK